MNSTMISQIMTRFHGSMTIVSIRQSESEDPIFSDITGIFPDDLMQKIGSTICSREEIFAFSETERFWAVDISFNKLYPIWMDIYEREELITETELFDILSLFRIKNIVKSLNMEGFNIVIRRPDPFQNPLFSVKFYFHSSSETGFTVIQEAFIPVNQELKKIIYPHVMKYLRENWRLRLQDSVLRITWECGTNHFILRDMDDITKNPRERVLRNLSTNDIEHVRSIANLFDYLKFYIPIEPFLISDIFVYTLNLTEVTGYDVKCYVLKKWIEFSGTSFGNCEVFGGIYLENETVSQVSRPHWFQRTYLHISGTNIPFQFEGLPQLSYFERKRITFFLNLHRNKSHICFRVIPIPDLLNNNIDIGFVIEDTHFFLSAEASRDASPLEFSALEIEEVKEIIHLRLREEEYNILSPTFALWDLKNDTVREIPGGNIENGREYDGRYGGYRR